MDDHLAIRVEGLSKRYHIGQPESYKTLRGTVMSTVSARFRRLSPPGKRAVRDSDQRGVTPSAYIWALKDVSFDVKRGDVVGIIGRNGAGKSTLLKILSRITKPTKGYAAIYGRVGSLLEIGTGFNPELTGQENVYLNGAILGMKKAEIDRKFDEIVAFAEVEQFIDTPVKHYSSGMYMRLAFAVAAHLEPDILMVDEVLAVGDLAFQKKCLGKMGEVTKEGRTVLFVSHSLDAIQRLCTHCLLFEQGQLVVHSDTRTVVSRYLSRNSYNVCPEKWIDVSHAERVGTGEAYFLAVQYSSLNQAAAFQPYPSGPLEFQIMIESDSVRSIGSLSVTLSNQSGIRLVNADIALLGQVVTLHKGSNLVKLRIDRLYLNPGVYRLGLWMADPISADAANSVYDFVESAFEIEVVKLIAEGSDLNPNSAVLCQFKFVEVT
jgi:lipopolysaccharide transport system ATP-binding protein